MLGDRLLVPPGLAGHGAGGTSLRHAGPNVTVAPPAHDDDHHDDDPGAWCSKNASGGQ